MNIFAVSPDPVACARALDDRRLNKMIIESAQILCSALHLNGRSAPYLYRPAYVRHPAVRWAAADTRNYTWLFRHLCALVDERRFRTGRAHATERLLPALGAHASADAPPSGFANCTPYKTWTDVHRAYRQTLLDKWARDIAPTWTRRGRPEFRSA